MLALFRLAAVVYLRLLPSTIRARMVERANSGFTGPVAASLYQALLKISGVGAWDGNEPSAGGVGNREQIEFVVEELFGPGEYTNEELGVLVAKAGFVLLNLDGRVGESYFEAPTEAAGIVLSSQVDEFAGWSASLPPTFADGAEDCPYRRMMFLAAGNENTLAPVVPGLEAIVDASSIRGTLATSALGQLFSISPPTPLSLEQSVPTWGQFIADNGINENPVFAPLESLVRFIPSLQEQS